MFPSVEKENKGKICSKCKEWKQFTSFFRDKAMRDGFHNQCKACEKLYKSEYQKYYHEKFPEKDREYHSQSLTKIRMKIIESLGKKCSNPKCLVPGRCTDLRCLQIDHKNGLGSLERKTKRKSVFLYYKYILKEIEKGSKNYQILCANCNWIKKCERKETGFRRGSLNVSKR